MYIRDRIFQKLEELSMTQKEFSEKTGIPQSTISDWRKKKTNPTAEKIMIICSVLGVTPEWLLSGTDTESGYRNRVDWFVVHRDSEIGTLIETFNQMDQRSRERLRGYMEALREMAQERPEK